MNRNLSRTFKIRVFGERACFTRPELKMERVSYETITPTAAKGCLESILWKPGMCWHITGIHILNEIKYDQLKRNEIKSKISLKGKREHFFIEDERVQRNTLFLKDVNYIVEAHFSLTNKAGERDNIIKFEEMFLRRLENGQFFYPPYLGCREFLAHIEKAPDSFEFHNSLKGIKPLGLMLHYIDFSGKETNFHFFDAKIEDGFIKVPEINNHISGVAMILQELYKLGCKLNLQEELNYDYRDINYILNIYANPLESKIEQISVKNDDTQSNKKSRQTGINILCPVPSGRSNNIKPEFFIDKDEYLFGFSFAENEIYKEKDEIKNKEKLNSSLELCREAMNYVPKESEDFMALKALESFYLLSKQEKKQIFENFIKEKISLEQTIDTDLLIKKQEKLKEELAESFFAIKYFSNNNPEYLFNFPNIKSFINSKLNYSPIKEEKWKTCLISGEKQAPVELHRVIKKIPNNTSGTSLINFNASVAESYGKNNNENAYIGINSAKIYAGALKYLLSDSPKTIDGESEKSKYIYVDKDTRCLFWNSNNNCEFINSLFEESEDHVKSMLNSAKNGKPSPIEDTSKFFMLILSGTLGRVIIRSFIENTTKTVAQSIDKYFSDTQIQDKYSDTHRSYSIREILKSLENLNSKEDTIPSRVTTQLYIASFFNKEFPKVLLAYTIQRNKAEPLIESYIDKNKRRNTSISLRFVQRCSLIKAYLLRSPTFLYKETLTVSLNTENTHPAYVLGRIFSAIEKVQQDSLGDNINAGISDRYYSSASTTPANIFPLLIKNSKHHLSKIRKESRGNFIYKEKLLTDLCSKISVFPKILKLEEQGLFALGYYQQRQDFFKSRNENEKGEDNAN